MKQLNQSENDENIDLSSYSVFKTSLINLTTWRFLVTLGWIFALSVLPVMIFAEVMGIAFLQDFMSNNGLLVSVSVFLLAIYVNFFLFNFTFLVGNERVIVYRLGFKGKKKIGEYFSSDYIFQFENIRGKDRGGERRKTGFFLVKSKDRSKRRSKSFPTGLSRFDIERMHYALDRL